MKAVRQALQKAHQHYGRIDGLINNAGRSYAAVVEEIGSANVLATGQPCNAVRKAFSKG
jgi:NAD(P)-dependent dehydrogenase (short-subunit alcohol dehydrogenase family)